MWTQREDSTGFTRELERLTDEQRTQWREAYNPKTQAFIFGGLSRRHKGLAFEDKENETQGRSESGNSTGYIKDYMRTIKSVDDGVREVLDYLEENGLADNAIVGIHFRTREFYLGEHGWLTSASCTEQSFSYSLIGSIYPKKLAGD